MGGGRCESVCGRVSEGANVQGAGWGCELEAIGLRENVCIHVLFEVSTERAQRIWGGS